MRRREFLRDGTYCGLALAFGGPFAALRAHAAAPAAPRAWEDLYRKEFLDTRGDAQGFAFHCSNCQGNCA